MPVSDDAPQADDGRPRPRQRAKSSRTRKRLLDAAAEIIRSEGVAGMTLDRVADVAGVSKGGLLYHYESKRALVRGLLDRTLGDADAALSDLAETNGRDRGAFAHAYLDYVTSGQHDEGAAATGIFAAAALEEGDLTPARDQFAAWQDRLLQDDGLEETAALLARVIGDGLWLIDLFDLAPPTPAQRQALANLVVDVIDGD